MAKEAEATWTRVASAQYIGGKSLQEQMGLEDAIWRIKIYGEILNELYRALPEIRPNKVPIANWPDEGVGKVVQLYVDDNPYLRFKRPELNERVRHGAILRDFLDQLGIAYETTTGLDTGNEIPAPNGEKYRAVGMGDFEVDWKNPHLIRCTGSSADYRLSIDQKHLDDVVRLQPEWSLTTKLF